MSARSARTYLGINVFIKICEHNKLYSYFKLWKDVNSQIIKKSSWRIWTWAWAGIITWTWTWAITSGSACNVTWSLTSSSTIICTSASTAHSRTLGCLRQQRRARQYYCAKDRQYAFGRFLEEIPTWLEFLFFHFLILHNTYLFKNVSLVELPK